MNATVMAMSTVEEKSTTETRSALVVCTLHRTVVIGSGCHGALDIMVIEEGQPMGTIFQRGTAGTVSVP